MTIELQPRESVPVLKGEALEQARLVAGLRRAGHLVFAIPNGEARSGGAGLRLKTQGVLAGAPDLVLIRPDGRVVWIEMKAGQGVLSDAQKAVHARLQDLGHRVIVARSSEDALLLLGL